MAIHQIGEDIDEAGAGEGGAGDAGATVDGRRGGRRAADDDRRPHHGATLDVDLAAVTANWRRIGALAPGAEAAAVVKADGYGLGGTAVARALAAAGAKTFFVGYVDGALKLRDAAPGAAIYTLNGLAPGDAGRYFAPNLRPVLNSAAELREWIAAAAGVGDAPPCAVQIDTGMNRAGLAMDEAGAAAAALRDAGVPVALVMSHLACADTPDHGHNAMQRERFAAVRPLFPTARASLANSGGVLLGADYHYDLVRPGIALYGGAPFMGGDPAARVTARLTAPIIRLVEAPAGEAVSYGAQTRLTGLRRIATISHGYADGWPRALSCGRGFAVTANGTRVPVAGRVTMDFTMFDVTDADPAVIAVGAPLELLGDRAPLDAQATAADTIGYELLVRLGRRVKRRYRW